jgi:hypothetical protein
MTPLERADKAYSDLKLESSGPSRNQLARIICDTEKDVLVALFQESSRTSIRSIQSSFSGNPVWSLGAAGAEVGLASRILELYPLYFGTAERDQISDIKAALSKAVEKHYPALPEV